MNDRWYHYIDKEGFQGGIKIDAISEYTETKENNFLFWVDGASDAHKLTYVQGMEVIEILKEGN